MHGSRHSGKLYAGLLAAGACVVLAGCAGGRGPAEPISFSAITEQDIIQAMEAFGIRLSEDPDNRMLLNFENLPAGVVNTNTFPGNFFSVNEPFQVTFSTPGTGLRVSSNNFADVNPTLGGEVGAFSIVHSFAPVGSNIVDVTFHPRDFPGSVAGVSGFGAVFSDVDTPGATTMEFFTEGDRSLGVFAVPVSTDPRRASFLGVHAGGPIITRVRIKLGTAAPAPGVNDISDGGTQDIVTLDDIMLDHPRPVF